MGFSTDIIKKLIPAKYAKSLVNIVESAFRLKSTGFIGWIKSAWRSLPVQFARIMLKMLKIFLMGEFRTFILELFKKAYLLQKAIDTGTITSEEAGKQLRKYAKEIAPLALQKAKFLINFSCEFVVFAVKASSWIDSEKNNDIIPDRQKKGVICRTVK